MKPFRSMLLAVCLLAWGGVLQARETIDDITMRVMEDIVKEDKGRGVRLLELPIPPAKARELHERSRERSQQSQSSEKDRKKEGRNERRSSEAQGKERKDRHDDERNSRHNDRDSGSDDRDSDRSSSLDERSDDRSSVVEDRSGESQEGTDGVPSGDRD